MISTNAFDDEFDEDTWEKAVKLMIAMGEFYAKNEVELHEMYQRRDMEFKRLFGRSVRRRAAPKPRASPAEKIEKVEKASVDNTELCDGSKSDDDLARPTGEMNRDDDDAGDDDDREDITTAHDDHDNKDDAKSIMKRPASALVVSSTVASAGSSECGTCSHWSSLSAPPAVDPFDVWLQD